MRRLVAALLMAALAALVAPLSPASGPASGATAPIWKLVADNEFTSGGLPADWTSYNGPYGSGPKNCAAPGHSVVGGGVLSMRLSYETTGKCGAGWYSAGLRMTSAYDSVDQKVRLRFRVLSAGGVVAQRIIPMRWPASGQGSTPGEEDYCEGSRVTGCTTFLHWAGTQIYHKYDPLNLAVWHTYTFVRRHFTVTAYIDGVRQWSYTGNSSTLPATLKHVVLQQECQQSGCPSGTTGREVIQIDWIKVWNPA